MPEIVKERVIAWLAEEDFEVKVETPPKEAPIEWAVRATSKVPAVVNIIVQQPRGKEDQLVLSLGVTVSEQHYRGLMRLKETDRAKLVYETLRDLTTLCPDCIIILQPSLIDLQRLIITKVLYTSSLDREKLMNSMRTLINMFGILSFKLSSSLGVIPTGKKPSDTSLGYI